MREIKFREWHNGKMLSWADLGHVGVDLHCILSDMETFKVMQYTGLKDKNGKEIYEGDIVFNDWHNISGTQIGQNWIVKFGEYDDSQIDWGSPAFGYFCENIEGEQESPLNMGGTGLRVIGNIYENAELLAK